MCRRILLLGSAAVIVALAALAAQRPEQAAPHPVLQRAAKSKAPAPPVAVLIEMGVKDTSPTDWSGKASVAGAKVVRREGYRFRTDVERPDRLIEPDGWEVSSHYSIRAPKGDPVIKRIEPIATVGVVLYLENVRDDATLTIAPRGENLPAAKVDLQKVLAGEEAPLWKGAAVVRRISSAIPVATGDTEDDQPAAAYGPDGTLWVAYTSYTLRDPSRRIEARPYQQQPKDFRHLYKPEFAEQVWLRPYRDGKWGKPIAVTDDEQDIARCALAVTNDNMVWVIYSAQRQGNFDIYARLFPGGAKAPPIPGDEVRLSDNPGPNLSPVACTDAQGTIHVAWQAWTLDGVAGIGTRRYAEGKWSGQRIDRSVDAGSTNRWHAALAAGPKGQAGLAYDVYGHGSYHIDFQLIDPRGGGSMHAAYGAHNRARPSVAFDPEGRIWIAYEYGPTKWGKDYGALDSNDGNPLYNTRSVRVLCLDNAKHFEPVAALPDLDPSAPQLPFDAIKTNQFEKRPRLAYPQIGLDGRGDIWLTYRKNFGSRYTSHPGAVWRTYARRLEGNRWSPEIEVHPSDGLLDHRPVLLPHPQGGLVIIHNTDGRFTTPNTINNQIYLSVIDLPGKAPKPELKAVATEGWTEPFVTPVKKEAEDVARIRSYRISVGGKTYQLLRGEYHRHTEISWDGAPDGSLEDMFRYAIDAAGMDWIGNGDHDNGAGREYSWYLVQKWSDAYRVAGRFTPMFTYERSVAYPHGHRNVMFAQRGILTLPRLAPPKDDKKYEGGVHPDDTKMLYRYLRAFDGICAMHTSATGMGTDWRDNDPKVEPIVEIYQGDRMSYEYEGAPRSGYDPKSGREPANVGGWKPLGFVDRALRDKGYKLAFQASSDHWSTHISYFVVIAEKNDRDGILDAVKRRHCYGATDNIIVDLRSGEHLQGDEFTTRGPAKLQFQVIGTNKIAKLDVLRDSKVVKTFTPDGNVYRGSWTDESPEKDSHYYYIRVLQTDGEVAWASPLWIRREK